MPRGGLPQWSFARGDPVSCVSRLASVNIPDTPLPSSSDPAARTLGSRDADPLALGRPVERPTGRSISPERT